MRSIARASAKSCRRPRDTGDDLARAGIDDVAKRVDGDHRRDDEAVRQRQRRAADAAFHGVRPRRRLADRGACAGADAALRDRRRRRRRGRLVSAVGGRTNVSVADRQIEQRRRRHNRHVRAGRTRIRCFFSSR